MAYQQRNIDIHIADTTKAAKPFYKSSKTRMLDSPNTTRSDLNPSSPDSSSDFTSCPSTPGGAFGLSGDEQYFDTLDAELGLLPSQFEDVLAQVYAERYSGRREKREDKDVGRLWESMLLREREADRGCGSGEARVRDRVDETAVPTKKKGKKGWTWVRDDADMEYDGDIDEKVAQEKRVDKMKEHRCESICTKRKRKVKTRGPRK